jgi:predicted RNase H-like HicB family nuclease
MKYTVVLEPQEEGGYFVQCMELPGAISQDGSKEEALVKIKEAIELVLEVQREELVKKQHSFRSEIIKVDVADIS